MQRSLSSADAVLAIRGLSVALPKGADRPYAVEDVGLAVRAREILCLVGESGSGKSVTAHSIMGLLPRGQLEPVAGQILLEGEDVLKASDQRLRALRCTRMSMIFQEPMTALNPVMMCGEQIDEVLRAHTDMAPGARTERILAIMRDVRLREPELLLHAYPHQLSGGQRQRIMIAIALVLEPALLIADEPTTALDVTTQAQILQLIKDIQRAHGTAVLFITHDFGVVAEIADRVAVMQWGKVVESGEARRVLSVPQHPYTRMLIGAVPSLTPRQRAAVPAQKPVLRTFDLTKGYGGGWLVEGPINYGLGGPDAYRRARSLMALVNLDPDALGRYPHQFSGGQRQRICIARALAMEPELLIADEAVSALDVSVQAQVLKVLAEIRRRLELALLFITHDLRVAAQVCDGVAVMHQGRVVEYGPVGEVFAHPKHDYTRSLFAAAPGKDFDFGRFAA